MNLLKLLTLLDKVGAVVARLPEFIELYEQSVAMLSEDDQAVAKEALAELQAENDEGHVSFQAKLAAAAAR